MTNATRPDDENSPANAIGPAGASANDDIGHIVSGQPAGGPDDIGAEAKDNAAIERDRPADEADMMGEGMDAHGKGVARDQCPHPEGSAEGDAWRAGWDRQQGLAGIS